MAPHGAFFFHNQKINYINNLNLFTCVPTSRRALTVRPSSVFDEDLNPAGLFFYFCFSKHVRQIKLLTLKSDFNSTLLTSL